MSNVDSPNQLFVLEPRILPDKSVAGGRAGAAAIEMLVTLFA
jgi:hypothetical protein